MSPFLVVIAVLVVVLLVLLVAFFLLGRGGTRFTFDIGGASPKASGGADASSETGFKNRLLGLGVFSGSIIGALLARLWSMQLLSSADYSAQAENNRTRTISLLAPRGRILDRNGKELVTNRASLSVVASADVADNAIAVHLLGNLIGMPAMAVKRKIQDSSHGAQSLRVVAVDVSRRVVAYIDEHPYLFDGVKVEQRSQRLYPQGSLAAHVLGYTGSITSEQVKAMDEAAEGSMGYELGDIVGQAGVEYQYESVLQGIKGEQTVYVDADGNILSHAGSVDAQAGSDVVLSIDSDIQRAAEESLEKNIKRLHDSGREDCNGGSAVVIDVTNGEVLAMASYPTYSPNVFVGGISTDDWEVLSSEKSNNPLMNRAISGQYPSASTIKPLSAFAALSHGIADVGTSYFCSGYWTGFGAAYGQYCWEKNGHGTMNLQTGITFSCDVVFYEIGKGFFYSETPEGLQETFRSWGLGAAEGIDLPGEAAGRVPDAEWKWNYFSSSDDSARSWLGGDTTNLAIGQGDLLVTPLQMACVYAGISLDGVTWRPHLLKSVRSTKGKGSVIEYKSSVLRTIQQEQSHLDLVRSGLKGVIYEESAAQASHFTNLSVSVAGKTGSAESSKTHPHGWFIAYAPIESPKYVVASTIEFGGFGSEGAMYVVRDILGEIYHEPDTSDEVETSSVR
ncbi:penicillin-binding protein 2 [Olsenella urininfantis]|uniref:penicillin-binding protein 2 n=1 Tax=Olsenella urininfantis TaxID=1871033 RepID=UPI00098765FD|nr:penicillin-binding protein 2 [Olsenella urininfantis]